MHQILIVDAEEDLLWALSKNLFKDRSDVKVRTAHAGEDALEILKGHDISVLVTDTRVGGDIDGFNLILRAKDVAPRARLVVMTAFSTDESKTFEPSLGVAHFINKPVETGELRALIETVLDEGEGFRGLMSDLSLADIMALLCLCQRTVLLHLNHRGRRGRFEVVDGDINHAEFDGKIGPEAVWTMLGLKGGDIFMQSDFGRSACSVEPNWRDLLRDAAGWLEEHGLPEEPEPEVEIPIDGWDDDDFEAADDDGDEFGGGGENPLGFSDADLAEIAAAEEAPPSPAEASGFLDRPPTEDTLPRTPRLGEGSGLRQLPPAPPPKRSSSTTDRMRGAAVPIRQLIETLREEIPAFVACDILDVYDGESLGGAVVPNAGFDHETASAFYGEVVRAALRAGSTFGETSLNAVQIATGKHYVLARVVPETRYAQVVFLERAANLGIARVVMRRIEALLYQAVPH